MGWKSLLVIGWLLITGIAHAAPVILVYGDSLSAGYGLAAHQAWPDLLQQRLTTKNWQIINASISGETTAGGLARLPDTLAQHHPKIVILALGANDGLRGLSMAAMYDNLNNMMQQIRNTGAVILLVGVHLPPNYGIAYTEKFQQVYTKLAQQHHVAYLPSLLANVENKRELFQADGLHPIAVAEPLVLDAVLDGLLPLLKHGKY
ncbi:arylesterase [Sulfuriferula nivalis]|uniref:Arylesterase n=1 Tax=Sulfuriferula nivalis TaxID=2675298 RepID=A0A809RHW1_9PROT|nr:arylesterase [Sulfuriferula nivalis]BBP00434.1 arylesterase [Sulfuriferula nivalis]